MQWNDSRTLAMVKPAVPLNNAQGESTDPPGAGQLPESWATNGRCTGLPGQGSAKVAALTAQGG